MNSAQLKNLGGGDCTWKDCCSSSSWELRWELGERGLRGLRGDMVVPESTSWTPSAAVGNVLW